MGDLARAFDEALQTQSFRCPLCGMQHEQCRAEFDQLGRMAKEFDITGMCPWCQLEMFISYDDKLQCRYWDEVINGWRVLEGDYSSKITKVLKSWKLKAKFQDDDEEIAKQYRWVTTIAIAMARKGLVDASVGDMAKTSFVAVR